MRTMPIDDFLTRDDEIVADPVPTERTYDWARLVREGRAARQSADGGRWRIGQLASLVERRYASGALRRFAGEIGESLGSVRRFRWVAESYDPNARLRFADLSYSHFQVVAALPDRLAWLQRAQRRGWSVDRLITESRANTPGVSSEVVVRRPIEAAIKRLARLAEQLEDNTLPIASRKSLASAVEELAAQVETLRACLAAKPARLKAVGSKRAR